MNLKILIEISSSQKRIDQGLVKRIITRLKSLEY
ncbi:hypothetical protein BFRIPA_00017 (plasmid) [Peribacillus frigoritolerans]